MINTLSRWLRYIYIYPSRNIRNVLRLHVIFYLEHSNWKCLYDNTWYFRNSFWSVSSCFIISTRDVFVNFEICVDLLGAELFLYFSHILLNFWMTIYVFAFRKLNNMSPVKPAFYFLTDFILDALIAMCPKSLYYPYN